MSCLMSHGTSSRWINLLSAAKHGLRSFATKSHMKKNLKRSFDTMVKSDKVVIFSKSNCGCSQAAKSLFDDIRTKYTAVELDRREDGPLIQAHLGIETGSMIMPRVFVLGKCVGGYHELVELHRNGTLIKLLNQDP